MSNGKIYSFGVPLENYWIVTASNTSWVSFSADSVSASLSVNKDYWADIPSKDQILFAVFDRLSNLIKEKQPVGIFEINTRPNEEYRKKTSSQTLKLPITDQFLNELNDNRSMNLFVGEILSKLEYLRDQVNTDIYIKTIELQRPNDITAIAEFSIELLLLGDITNSCDVIDPITGEIKIS